jgi:hypothetical protein
MAEAAQPESPAILEWQSEHLLLCVDALHGATFLTSSASLECVSLPDQDQAGGWELDFAEGLGVLSYSALDGEEPLLVEYAQNRLQWAALKTETVQLLCAETSSHANKRPFSPCTRSSRSALWSVVLQPPERSRWQSSRTHSLDRSCGGHFQALGNFCTGKDQEGRGNGPVRTFTTGCLHGKGCALG